MPRPLAAFILFHVSCANGWSKNKITVAKTIYFILFHIKWVDCIIPETCEYHWITWYHSRTRTFFPVGRFFSTSFCICEHHSSKKKLGFVYDFSVSFPSVLQTQHNRNTESLLICHKMSQGLLLVGILQEVWLFFHRTSMSCHRYCDIAVCTKCTD